MGPRESGKLVLGSSTPTRPKVRLQLADLGGHPPSWLDRTTLCWSAPTPGCFETALDTGTEFNDLVVYDASSATPGSMDLPSEVPIDISKAGATTPFYSFETSNPPDRDSVQVETLAGGVKGTETSGVLGVSIFYAMAVTYDPIHGQIILSN